MKGSVAGFCAREDDMQKIQSNKANAIKFFINATLLHEILFHILNIDTARRNFVARIHEAHNAALQRPGDNCIVRQVVDEKAR
jgi:hypothetical protein